MLKQSIFIATLIASMMGSNTVEGQEKLNLPRQTFQQYIELAEKLGQEIEYAKPKSKQQEQKYVKEFNSTITFYTNHIESTGKTSRSKGFGITASGKRTRANHTISMDKSIPFGTVVEIVGLGIFTVEDRGGRIRGNRIDVYVPTVEEAIKLGKQKRQVRIIKWGDGKRSGQ